MATGTLPICGIYVIRRGARCYVGSSIDIAKRWKEHRRMLYRGRHHAVALQRSWAKYGPIDFVFEIVERVPLWELLAAEQRWIDQLNAASPSLGFNLSPTAGLPNGTFAKSAEHRAKIGAAHVGMKRSPQARANMSAARKASPKAQAQIRRLIEMGTGRTPSNETRAKMSRASRGKPKSASHRAALAKDRRRFAATPEGKLSQRRASEAAAARRRALRADKLSKPPRI